MSPRCYLCNHELEHHTQQDKEACMTKALQIIHSSAVKLQNNDDTLEELTAEIIEAGWAAEKMLRAVNRFVTKHVPDFDTKHIIHDGIIYLSKSYVKFNCPCGGGHITTLPINRKSGTFWKLEEHDGTISLDPSIHDVDVCRFHYSIKHGKVQWE